MARFRKLDVRLRSDEKFQALSAPQPNGQDCWIYLLTNRYTSNIPGLYAAYEEAMARDLKWSTKGFRESFGELFRNGLAKADWTVGLVFIPNAIRYDPPANPNVVKGWRSAWDELPECELKNQAHDHIYEFLKRLGEPYAKPFAERCPKGSGNRMPKQEQEQEQEQEQDIQPRSCSDPARPPLPGKPSKTERALVDRWRAEAENVLAAISQARKQVNPKARELQPSYTSLSLIAARLDEGRSSLDCLHVVDVCLDESRRDKKSYEFFDSITPFRPENFERKLARTVNGQSAPKAKGPAFDAFALTAEPPPKGAA